MLAVSLIPAGHTVLAVYLIPAGHTVLAVSLIPTGHTVFNLFSSKYLAVLLDHELLWSNHISYITKVISRKFGVMSKLCQFLPASLIVLLRRHHVSDYFSFVMYSYERSCLTQRFKKCMLVDP